MVKLIYLIVILNWLAFWKRIYQENLITLWLHALVEIYRRLTKQSTPSSTLPEQLTLKSRKLEISQKMLLWSAYIAISLFHGVTFYRNYLNSSVRVEKKNKTIKRIIGTNVKEKMRWRKCSNKYLRNWHQTYIRNYSSTYLNWCKK